VFEDHRLPNEPRNRGWNRASIIFWSRKQYRPRARPDDLAMLRAFGKLRLLGFCLVAAFGTTAVLVWTPLFLLDLYVDVGGAVFGATLGTALFVFTVLFYWWSVRVTRRDRELAARL